MATRFECSNKPTYRCDRGEGKPKRKKCSVCGSAFYTFEGTWATFVWTGTNRYPLEDAVGTFPTETAANEATASTELVVRWIPT